MDSYGTFLECGVFTASQTHYFPQHGLVDTPDRVGNSSAQPCRLQSFRQVYSLQGAQHHSGKASGRWIDAEGIKRYHALTTAEVLRWLKLVPTHLELQIRRLSWWQSILLDREGNEALLGHLLWQSGSGRCRTTAGQGQSFSEC